MVACFLQYEGFEVEQVRRHGLGVPVARIGAYFLAQPFLQEAHFSGGEALIDGRQFDVAESFYSRRKGGHDGVVHSRAAYLSQLELTVQMRLHGLHGGEHFADVEPAAGPGQLPGP